MGIDDDGRPSATLGVEGGLRVPCGDDGQEVLVAPAHPHSEAVDILGKALDDANQPFANLARRRACAGTIELRTNIGHRSRIVLARHDLERGSR